MKSKIAEQRQAWPPPDVISFQFFWFLVLSVLITGVFFVFKGTTAHDWSGPDATSRIGFALFFIVVAAIILFLPLMLVAAPVWAITMSLLRLTGLPYRVSAALAAFPMAILASGMMILITRWNWASWEQIWTGQVFLPIQSLVGFGLPGGFIGAFVSIWIFRQ